jgi:hypothetical protein
LCRYDHVVTLNLILWDVAVTGLHTTLTMACL